MILYIIIFIILNNLLIIVYHNNKNDYYIFLYYVKIVKYSRINCIKIVSLHCVLFLSRPDNKILSIEFFFVTKIKV